MLRLNSTNSVWARMPRLRSPLAAPRRGLSQALTDRTYPHLYWYPHPCYLPPLTTTDSGTDASSSRLTPALSFLSPVDLQTTAAVPDELTTIGWVPNVPTAALQPPHTTIDSAALLTPTNFIANGTFFDWLHATLKAGAHDADPMFVAQAKTAPAGENWVHIADERHPPPYGRIPRPEDIVGSVKVIDGRIVPGSYERMFSHRPVTVKGLFQLSAGFQDYIIRELKKEAARRGQPS
ncbi:hypothetical protein IWQ60_009628 [Tieghemiomyces parasiticus]|uniref:Uncharacterized protein n=1 Tax=Tieghemiomyces parasiticus TaxID=78921 RepID=A0A9W7ZME4_9FUNG|nr:hypothetical protein IWQ60_009628 [Tieghemiomyces parasiticus]